MSYRMVGGPMLFVIGPWTFLRALLFGSVTIALENLALRHQLGGCSSALPAAPGSLDGTGSSGSGEGARRSHSVQRYGDPGGIRTRDLDLERVASLARLDDGV
jgi:hypothetical protein